MGRKVFVSYKYGDTLVRDMKKRDLKIVGGNLNFISRPTRARDYVDELQKKIGKDNINLGEKDGESLRDFSDNHIETLLKQRIRQCSVTIVLISKGMQEILIPEEDQWIPWEVSYSLRVVSIGERRKQMNAVLGIVIPDETGTYAWYYTENRACNSVTHQTSKLFKILRDNMFNIIDKEIKECNGTKIHVNSEPSFIKTVKWDDFMNSNDHDFYIERAIEIKDDKNNYDVHINLD
ncbi:MTH538 TIR-like domain [Aquiflexum balticum DSM 16537]|uniref:MTH538 TIR-like domain n=1 Tax=Aquiflexum balticum DSM 16537 TaxID=758820 RepID=A0A1W2HB24_9BACT|nr:TIR domain-containing protein [Aquiflexum balticum]SMD45776.1 MTH538 TIR-like domain [Aquiflexum balticum DSM 16537]